MALHTSTFPSSLVPAKISISNRAILRTSCVILHPPSPFLSLSISATPIISSKPFQFSLKATSLQEYTYPDPIPEFAIAETAKFKAELSKKLSKEKETFGDDLDMVVDTCAEIFSQFLHKEYRGPGTLLVEPFTDMMIELKEKKLPGAPLAARSSLLWAQNYVDQDWEIWNSSRPPKRF